MVKFTFLGDEFRGLDMTGWVENSTSHPCTVREC